MNLDGIGDPSTWIALLTVTLMEIVLGIDNIIFISILTGRLPPEHRKKTARQGILLALGLRIALLFSIAWIMRLTEPLFTLWGVVVSGKSLVLLGGGLFLVGKSTVEIHHKIEGDHSASSTGKAVSRASVLGQIALLDLVFSLDSVITAVGMVPASQIWVMVTAILISVAVMWFFAEPVSTFVDRHPTVKVLALSFLILIGVLLVAEGIGQHIAKGYIYFAMAFSLVVELLNQRVRRKGSAPQTPEQAQEAKLP